MAVSLATSMQVAISFATNYTLKPPGKCAGQPDCGHVWVLVDGTGCNLQGKTYNALASASPTSADLSKCVTPTGMHTITLELRKDDGTKFTDPKGGPLSAKVVITAQ